MEGLDLNLNSLHLNEEEVAAKQSTPDKFAHYRATYGWDWNIDTIQKGEDEDGDDADDVVQDEEQRGDDVN
ncbi:uncharacterized protein Z518_06716 [Rhinocladiella mackenziei CBS 650.93]|uniref:Uncharacterized protein n=1 Tax=Rhinocladiella mackenziei CBS 650.93 TaxID=1442369 RepID=A0A0D2J2K6_9EURO|nr:uncharacterized protein Z518_06716 [Rhinocladiella mackenziei CBS 650.93]KIX03165.1 hypothetical protein Z518_06716 [Rhinocladiella mackenziei CBS 650.93]